MHICPIKVCSIHLPDDRVMCRTHWFMVPEDLRTEVWRANNQFNARRTDRARLQCLRDLQRRAIDAVEARLEATSNPRRSPA